MKEPQIVAALTQIHEWGVTEETELTLVAVYLRGGGIIQGETRLTELDRETKTLTVHQAGQIPAIVAIEAITAIAGALEDDEVTS